MMKNNFCVLFSLDGVLIDTASQYTGIWRHIGEKYGSETVGLEYAVMDKSLYDILEKYFSHLSDKQKLELKNELKAREAGLKIQEMKGVRHFIEELKNKGIKMGLVTNSSQIKLQNVYEHIDLHTAMDTIVSIENTAKFKSPISGFRLAAKELEFEPQDCYVFASSLNTIETTHLNGMKVIAVSTTLPKDALKNNTISVISDFTDFPYEKLI